MIKKKIEPRGIRNNNPLNIRIGNTWLGEVNDPTDSEFEQFCSMEYGCRAAFCILRRYIKRYKLNNISQIISRWAPKNENATQAYIDHVCNQMGYTPDSVIEYENRDAMCKLVAAMAVVENGQSIPYEKIQKGYDIA